LIKFLGSVLGSGIGISSSLRPEWLWRLFREKAGRSVNLTITCN